MYSTSRFLIALSVAALAAVPLAQVAEAETQAPDVPGDIKVDEGYKPFLSGHAVGVQIYRCNASAAGFAWGLVAPRATVYDDKGKPIIEHFGGPTWQARDGSTVVAARDGQANVDPTAIPWLRLKAVSTSAGPDGDRLVKTSYIQRVNTTRGLPPAAADCGAATVGTQVEVPYTADYYFWRPAGH
jgi:hypothetical protein